MSNIVTYDKNPSTKYDRLKPGDVFKVESASNQYESIYMKTDLVTTYGETYAVDLVNGAMNAVKEYIIVTKLNEVNVKPDSLLPF
jgi:hypothetical protein